MKFSSQNRGVAVPRGGSGLYKQHHTSRDTRSGGGRGRGRPQRSVLEQLWDDDDDSRSRFGASVWHAAEFILKPALTVLPVRYLLFQPGLVLNLSDHVWTDQVFRFCISMMGNISFPPLAPTLPSQALLQCYLQSNTFSGPAWVTPFISKSKHPV